MYSYISPPCAHALPGTAGAARCTSGCLHKQLQAGHAGSCLASLLSPEPPAPPPPTCARAHYLCLPYLQIEQVYMAVLGALPLPQDWFNRPHAVLADADLHPNKHLTWNPQKGPKAAVTHAT